MDVEQIARPGTLRPGFEAAIRTELACIIADPAFQNSPTLIRLLQYLIEETLAGRGDRLKAYSIAVDGLGRAGDFDTQSDSYPRVQVGRLRKALSIYYAKNAPQNELCLYLAQGSYKMRLGRPGIAYPDFFRPLSGRASDFEQRGALSSLTLNGGFAPPILKRLSNRPVYFWLALAVFLSVALAAVFLLPSLHKSKEGKQPDASVSGGSSPLLLVSHVTASATPRTTDLAQNAYAVLTDGLSRSWVARVRADPLTESGIDPNSAGAAYRLDTQFDDGANGTYTLFARLTDAKTSSVIWSTSLSVSSKSNSLSDDLAPLISQISGPYGAIAAYETHRLEGSFAPGYPCLLQYLTFLGSRDPGAQPAITQCLSKSVDDPRLEATRLAFSSMFALSAANRQADRAVAVSTALGSARKAIEVAPDEAYAHFALARAAFVLQDCNTGRQQGNLAIKANPYDPVILSTVGGFSNQCGFEEGKAILEQAYRFYVPGNSYARLQLILAQIQQGRLDRLSKLTEIRQPRSGPSLAYYFLCETLINAAQDQRQAAAANWAKFVAASPPPRTSNDEMLSAIILSKQVRMRVLALLERKGVLAGSPRPSPVVEAR